MKINVQMKDTINIINSENPYYSETTHLNLTVNQSNGFCEIKSLITWNFPRYFKIEY